MQAAVQLLIPRHALRPIETKDLHYARRHGEHAVSHVGRRHSRRRDAAPVDHTFPAASAHEGEIQPTSRLCGLVREGLLLRMLLPSCFRASERVRVDG